MKSVCIAILNYNGVHHLEHLLPSIQTGIESYEGRLNTVVLDNKSTKNDEQWMRSHYPKVDFITAPANEFMYSYNWLAAHRQEDVLILLNNDTRLLPNFVSNLLKHFHSKNLFSVCAHSLDWEGTSDTCGPVQLKRSKHGFYKWAFETSRQELAYTTYSSSGFMAVDRLKFLELGGFCRLFYPMYCDDLDLGFRAWQRGWHSIYEPEALLHHRENGSGASKWVRHHDLRNSLLFEWSSLPIEQYSFSRGPRQLKLILSELMHGRTFWLSAWWEASKIWRANKQKYSRHKISESQYLELAQKLSNPVKNS